MPTRANLYVSDDLSSWLEKRRALSISGGALPAVIISELEMWRAHLHQETQATIWPLGQINLVADVLNGSQLLDASVGRAVHYEVLDAVQQHPGAYGAKWGVDEDDLTARTGALSLTANHGTAAAVATWWDAGLEPTREGWATVGIRTIQEPA